MEIGKIAASTAGDQDLGADPVGMVKQQDFPAPLAGSQGAHESRCTGPQNNDVEHLRSCRHSPFAHLPVVPVPLLHNLKHNKVIHQRIVLLHVVTENVPYVAADKRIQVTHLMDNFHSVVVHYGFMEQPNIPQALEECSTRQLHFAMMDTSFFVGRVTIVADNHSRIGGFRRQLFEVMHRNALAATEFFRIPPNRVVELGGQVEI